MAYPTSLPVFSADSYSYSDVDEMASAPMEAGPDRRRRTTRGSDTVFTVQTVMTSEQLDIFEAWYASEAAHGAVWFTINLIVGIGSVPHVARFVGHYSVYHGGHRAWVVAAKLETRSRVVLDADGIAAAQSADLRIMYAVIDDTGGQLFIFYNRPASRGSSYNDTDLALSVPTGGDDIELTYASGDGADMWTVTISTPIIKGDTVIFDYNGRVDGIKDSAGADLGAVDALNVYNGSDHEGNCTTSEQVFTAYDGTEYKKLAIDQSTGTVYAAYSTELRRKLPGEAVFCIAGHLPVGYRFSGISIDRTSGVLYAVGFDAAYKRRVFVYDDISGTFTVNGGDLPAEYWHVEAICVHAGVIYVGGQNGSSSGCVFCRPVSGDTWELFYSGYTEHPWIDGVYCSDVFVDAAGDMFITWGTATYLNNSGVYGSIVTKYSGGVFADIFSASDNDASGFTMVATRRHNSKSYFVATEVSLPRMVLYVQDVDGGPLSKLDYTIDNYSNGWDEYDGLMFSIGAFSTAGDELSSFLSYSLQGVF